MPTEARPKIQALAKLGSIIYAPVVEEVARASTRLSAVDADQVVSRTRRYLGTPAVVGFEEPFLDVLRAELIATGRTIQRTSGVLAAAGPGAPLISAHVDRHVLDTSPFDTSDEAERGVVVLRHRDAGGHFDPDRTTHIAAAAQTSGVEIVWKDTVLEQSGRPLGRTELGRLIAATGGEVTGSTLQVPTTDYHSNFEATTTGAIAATLATLTAYVDAAQPT